MKEDPKEVLYMILDMWSIHANSLDKAKKAIKQCNKIHTYALRLEKKLHITNKKKELAVSLFQQQTMKIKHDKRMIDALKSLVFVKTDMFLPSLKKLIDQRSSPFTHALLPSVNWWSESKRLQPICNTHTDGDDGSLRSKQLKRPYWIPLFFPTDKIHLYINDCIRCKANL